MKLPGPLSWVSSTVQQAEARRHKIMSSAEVWVQLFGASVAYAILATTLHEAAHAFAAIALGHRCSLRFTLEHICVCVPEIPQNHARIVRHSGWVASCALALVVLASTTACWTMIAAFSFVAVNATASDLLGLLALEDGASSFACGNFGLIALRSLNRRHVLPILRLMLRTTMVRGAQSAGIVCDAQSFKATSAPLGSMRRLYSQR